MFLRLESIQVRSALGDPEYVTADDAVARASTLTVVGIESTLPLTCLNGQLELLEIRDSPRLADIEFMSSILVNELRVRSSRLVSLAFLAKASGLRVVDVDVSPGSDPLAGIASVSSSSSLERLTVSGYSPPGWPGEGRIEVASLHNAFSLANIVLIEPAARTFAVLEQNTNPGAESAVFLDVRGAVNEGPWTVSLNLTVHSVTPFGPRKAIDDLCWAEASVCPQGDFVGSLPSYGGRTPMRQFTVTFPAAHWERLPFSSEPNPRIRLRTEYCRVHPMHPGETDRPGLQRGDARMSCVIRADRVR